MHRYVKRLTLAACLLATACTPFYPLPDTPPEERLYRLFDKHFRTVPPQESRKLAREIVAFARHLEQRYERTTPAIVHNALINLGFKRKGLCWHYADALYAHLRCRYPHYRFFLAGAFVGSYWKEHNALIVTDATGDISRGIVIDAWRSPGEVIAVAVEKDSYPWRVRLARQRRYGACQ